MDSRPRARLVLCAEYVLQENRAAKQIAELLTETEARKLASLSSECTARPDSCAKNVASWKSLRNQNATLEGTHRGSPSA
jgi:hypothetical protein